MKNLLVATVFLFLSGQAFAQSVVDEGNQGNLPPESPALKQIMLDNERVSSCMAVWETLGRMDVATGLMLINDPETSPLGEKYLNDGQFETAKTEAALLFVVKTFPGKLEKEKLTVPPENVLRATMMVFGSYNEALLTNFIGMFGTDLHENFTQFAKLRTEEASCDAFMLSLDSSYIVEKPEPVDLAKIRSGE